MSPESLPEIASTHLNDPVEPQTLVTFLNRALKRRGLIFGIARQDNGYLLTVYATEPWSGERGGD
jgi:hypothetical protein